MELKTETEQKILEAAKTVFVEKGFDGTRMQHIADEARINKALLHYYYRTKEKLFDAVFSDSFNRFIPKIAELLISDLPLKSQIEKFVNSYVDMLIQNPHLPHFIFHELKRKPEMIVEALTRTGMKPDYFIDSVNKEIQEGNIRPVSPFHLMINILSMCIFPFIAKPMIIGFAFKNDKQLFDKFISERKKEVVDFIINSIYI